MIRQGKTLDELDDLLGLRVILRPRVTRKLPTGLHRQRQCILCYRVLEVAHGLYPVAGGGLDVKDYISRPQENGYQSLHSTVRLGGGTSTEIQIRTSEMHRYAEHGKAAHWLFKCDDGRPAEDWYDLGLDEAVIGATVSAAAEQKEARARRQKQEEALRRQEEALRRQEEAKEERRRRWLQEQAQAEEAQAAARAGAVRPRGEQDAAAEGVPIDGQAARAQRPQGQPNSRRNSSNGSRCRRSSRSSSNSSSKPDSSSSSSSSGRKPCRHPTNRRRRRQRPHAGAAPRAQRRPGGGRRAAPLRWMRTPRSSMRRRSCKTLPLPLLPLRARRRTRTRTRRR